MKVLDVCFHAHLHIANVSLKQRVTSVLCRQPSRTSFCTPVWTWLPHHTFGETVFTAVVSLPWLFLSRLGRKAPQGPPETPPRALPGSGRNGAGASDPQCTPFFPWRSCQVTTQQDT